MLLNSLVNRQWIRSLLPIVRSKECYQICPVDLWRVTWVRCPSGALRRYWFPQFACPVLLFPFTELVLYHAFHSQFSIMHFALLQFLGDPVYLTSLPPSHVHPGRVLGASPNAKSDSPSESSSSSPCFDHIRRTDDPFSSSSTGTKLDQSLLKGSKWRFIF